MRLKKTNNTGTEIEKDVENKTAQTITTDDYTLDVTKLRQGEHDVWELELKLAKQDERRTKKYTLSSNEKQKIDKQISGLLQLDIRKLVLYFGDISYDNANDVSVTYSARHPICKEVKAELTKYALENYSDFIEELKK